MVKLKGGPWSHFPMNFTELKIHIGRRVAMARKARGFTQAKLAEALRCEPEWVSQLERGKTPSLDMLWSIATVLQISLTELVGDDVPARPTLSPSRARLHAVASSLPEWQVEWAADVLVSMAAAVREHTEPKLGSLPSIGDGDRDA